MSLVVPTGCPNCLSPVASRHDDQLNIRLVFECGATARVQKNGLYVGSHYPTCKKREELPSSLARGWSLGMGDRKPPKGGYVYPERSHPMHGST